MPSRGSGFAHQGADYDKSVGFLLVRMKVFVGRADAKRRLAKSAWCLAGSCESCCGLLGVFASYLGSKLHQHRKHRKIMPTLRVSLDFARLPDGNLGDFGSTVSTKLENNSYFTTLPIPVATVKSQVAAFTAAVANAAQGGTQLTAIKNAARATVIESLRVLAAYVLSAGQNSLEVILSSGFEVNKTDRTRRPLDKPAITNIDNFASTQLMIGMPPVGNARAYEFRTRVGSGDWKNAGVFTKARGVLLGDLTPGATYDVQARAVGGSTGYSDWSDPVSHMAT